MLGLPVLMLHGLAYQTGENVTSWFLSLLPTQRSNTVCWTTALTFPFLLLCFQNRKHMHLARERTAATDGVSLPAEGTEE